MKLVMSAIGLALLGLVVAMPRSAAQTPGTNEKELVALEYQVKDAVVRRDAAALQRLYADEYMSTDTEGTVWTKTEDIEIDTAGMFQLASYSLGDLKVRTFEN